MIKDKLLITQFYYMQKPTTMLLCDSQQDLIKCVHNIRCKE